MEPRERVLPRGSPFFIRAATLAVALHRIARHEHRAFDGLFRAWSAAGRAVAGAGDLASRLSWCCAYPLPREEGGGWSSRVSCLPSTHGSTARAAFHASGLGRCDGRHRLLFEYPIIFWTPFAPMHFLDNRRSVK
jgi:hypothetical protein